MINKLDNPVWYALSESHNAFSVQYGDVKFYEPEFCPFGGLLEKSSCLEEVEKYSLLCNNFYIVGKKPDIPDLLKLERELVCNQMIIHAKINTIRTEKIVSLGNEHKDELL